jgi:hypothetical protein
MFQVECGCGKAIPVQGGQAGSTIICKCGRPIRVPPLSQLRQAAPAPPPEPAAGGRERAAWWWGVGLLAGGEVAQLSGWVIAGTAHGGTLGMVAFMAIVVGYVAALVGLLLVGAGKGFALWFCLLLLFCLPFGRWVVLLVPGPRVGRRPPPVARWRRQERDLGDETDGGGAAEATNIEG